MVALPARLCQRAAYAFAGRVGWIVKGLVASTMPSEVSPAGLVGAERCPPGTSALPAFFRESWAKNFTRLRRARELVS